MTTAAEQTYRYTATKTEKQPLKHPLKRLTLWVSKKHDMDAAQRAANHGGAIAAGVPLAKELGDLPGNICTPTYLAERVQDLATAAHELDVEVLEEHDMEELGMGALLSVSRGSREPAKLIVMRYAGGKTGDKPVVLVGKGLTFDAGGISIKPAADMDEMKYDMCGGASVIGAVAAAVALGLPINLIGVVPASENLPDGAANKPGDIVTSMSGQTVEILNTDAEGRLILCDALTYSERFDPAVVIDLATLTGACVVALGKHAGRALQRRRQAGRRGPGAPATTRATGPGACPCGTTTSASSTATLPTWPTSAGAKPGPSPPPASWPASPRTTRGPTWTSPASPGAAARKRAPRVARWRC